LHDNRSHPASALVVENKSKVAAEDSKLMNTLKGIGAVLAGIIFIVVTHSVTDLILESLGIFTPPSQGLHTPWMLVTATAYRALWTIVGGYVTAMLAPSPKMRWVAIFALIGFVLGVLGAVITIPMNLSPAWYPITLAVLLPICAWVGGKLRDRQTPATVNV
jgi:hypothetical protein